MLSTRHLPHPLLRKSCLQWASSHPALLSGCSFLSVVSCFGGAGFLGAPKLRGGDPALFAGNPAVSLSKIVWALAPEVWKQIKTLPFLPLFLSTHSAPLLECGLVVPGIFAPGEAFRLLLLRRGARVVEWARLESG